MSSRAFILVCCQAHIRCEGSTQIPSKPSGPHCSPTPISPHDAAGVAPPRADSEESRSIKLNLTPHEPPFGLKLQHYTVVRELTLRHLRHSCRSPVFLFPSSSHTLLYIHSPQAHSLALSHTHPFTSLHPPCWTKKRMNILPLLPTRPIQGQATPLERRSSLRSPRSRATNNRKNVQQAKAAQAPCGGGCCAEPKSHHKNLCSSRQPIAAGISQPHLLVRSMVMRLVFQPSRACLEHGDGIPGTENTVMALYLRSCHYRSCPLPLWLPAH